MTAQSRRDFLQFAAGGIVAATTLGAGEPPESAAVPPIRAVAFDAFPIFDPRPVFRLAEEIFPGKGAALSDDWRSRQFEYAWLRALSRRYADFWTVTEEALVYAARKQNLVLTAADRDQLMNRYLELNPWPDVLTALQSLRETGIRLAFLSNLTPHMLEECARHSGIAGLFEHILSTDAAKTYKPDPRAYQIGVDALRLRREEILFAAFAGWDAAGARSFGYPTFWVNRLNQPAEELGASPDAVGATLNDLTQFVAARNAAAAARHSG